MSLISLVYTCHDLNGPYFFYMLSDAISLLQKLFMTVGGENRVQRFIAKCEAINSFKVMMSHNTYAWHMHTTFQVCFDDYRRFGLPKRDDVNTH